MRLDFVVVQFLKDLELVQSSGRLRMGGAMMWALIGLSGCIHRVVFSVPIIPSFQLLQYLTSDVGLWINIELYLTCFRLLISSAKSTASFVFCNSVAAEVVGVVVSVAPEVSALRVSTEGVVSSPSSTGQQSNQSLKSLE